MKYLEFFVSSQKEKDILVEMFQADKTATLEHRIMQYNFPAELAKRINGLPAEDWDSDLDNLLNKTYKKNLKELEEALEFFNLYWENNEEYFFDRLKNIFKKEVDKYSVLLSNYVSGTSDWIGTNICTNAYSYRDENENYHTYFLLFEIILSETFKIIRKDNTEQYISDHKVWIISELTSFTILHEEWNVFNDVITKTYYDQVDKFIPEAKEIYKESGNIYVFFEKFIKLLINSE
jgi:hypothetical protein